MKKIIFLVFIAVLLSGCAVTNPFGKGVFNSTTGQPQQTYNYEKHVSVVPKYVVQEGKKEAIANEVQVQETIGMVRTEPKLSFWQKLWNRFWLWLIIFGAILFFVPGAASFFFWRTKKVAGVTVDFLKTGMKQTVTGVESFLKTCKNEEEKQRLLNCLSKEMDKETKVLVTELKQS